MSPPGNVAERAPASAPGPATPVQPVVRMLSVPAAPVAPPPAPGPDVAALLAALSPALEDPAAEGSTLAIASALAWHLGVERASLGTVDGGEVRLLAVSDAPDRAPRSSFARSVEAAMAEAARVGQTVQACGAPGDPQAHRRLVEAGGARAVASLPLRHAGTIRGVLVLERLGEVPIDARALAVAQTLSGVLGAALDLRRRARRARALAWLRGRRRAGALFAMLVLLAVSSVARVDYRLSVPARVEGRVQRVVVAPFDGYVESASVRAGERVTAGQELARLQRSALELERSSEVAAREELAKQYRRALAGRDRAEARVLEARIAQAEARIALLDARLARTRLTAPFDGVVLSGDLARSLGAPVERGQVLFEIAPADGHRLVLRAGQRDVGDLAVGMRGELALAALPGRTFPLTVRHVGGLARTEAAGSAFLAEAGIGGDTSALRPGMEGVARVIVEPRPLLWVVTHRLVEWLGLTLWTVRP